MCSLAVCQGDVLAELPPSWCQEDVRSPRRHAWFHFCHMKGGTAPLAVPDRCLTHVWGCPEHV